jgi:ABC-type transporter MlaC component
MQAEGIWLAVTERADFTSYLQQHGGNVTLLSGELHDRAAAIRTVLAMAK